jgi:hypothetical protein
MKFMKMNNIKKVAIMAIAALTVFSCEDPDKAPVVTFDSAGHGGYPRLIVETGSQLINIQTEADFNASVYGYSIDFVDEAKGGNVSEYFLEVTFEAVDGSTIGPIVLQSWSASEFADSDAGYKGVAGISITGPGVASALGLTYADLVAGDNFEVTGTVVMTNGDVFEASNSSSSVKGAAFRGHFDFTLPAACPSDLTGTFDVTTSLAGWCGGTATGTVDIEALGGGSYGFSDWSFGAYGVCWGGGAAAGDFSFVDVCQVVTLKDGTDSYGDSWTFTSSISGEEWTIVWVNFTYASGLENGISTITFPGGVPFTLAP